MRKKIFISRTIQEMLLVLLEENHTPDIRMKTAAVVEGNHWNASTQ